MILFYKSTLRPCLQKAHQTCRTHLQTWYSEIKSFYQEKVKPGSSKAYSTSSEWLKQNSRQAGSHCKTILLPKFQEIQNRAIEALRKHSIHTTQFIRYDFIPYCTKAYQMISESLKQAFRGMKAYCRRTLQQTGETANLKTQSRTNSSAREATKSLKKDENTIGTHMKAWSLIALGAAIGMVLGQIFSGPDKAPQSSGHLYTYTPEVTYVNRLAAKAALWPVARDLLASKISDSVGVPICLNPCSKNDDYWWVSVGNNTARGYMQCRIHHDNLVEILALAINAMDNDRNIPGGMIWDLIRAGM